MRFSSEENPPFDALALAYGKGLLTPFTGAGLSYPACPSWPQFIERLEVSAAMGGPEAQRSSDLIRRASRATQALRHASATALVDAVHGAIYQDALGPDGCLDTPPSALALSRIWWPLVLTTNYDALFIDAWNREWVHEKDPTPDPLPDFAQMLPMGRGRVDCQRVLNSARAPDNPLLWALQGFLPLNGGAHGLADQLAIGHEEYRRQTHEAIHFRRAFAEIYRSRTLLFIGSGLKEGYFLDLFGEALELLGTIGHFHYALVPAGETDVEFLRKRLQILAIEYPKGDHTSAVTAFLDRLKRAIDGRRPRTSRWTMTLDVASESRARDAIAEIAILRGGIHRSDDPNVATVVGAGRGSSGLKIGKDSKRVIASFGLDSEPERLPLDRIDDTHAYRVAGHPLYVVVARNRDRTGSVARDSREIASAIQELMENASAQGFARVETMVLAAGRQRTFPSYMALHEMVRGYCQWYAETPEGRRIPLWICTKDPRLINLLESGRIELASMTDSARLQFWIEIDTGEDPPAPVLAIADASSAIAALACDYAISGPAWTASVRPAPTKTHSPGCLDDLAREGMTLRDFGVLAGSTVVFRRTS